MRTPHLIITSTATPLPHPLEYYTSRTTPSATVHTTIHSPQHMQPAKKNVSHCDTIRLQSPPRAMVIPLAHNASPQRTHHLYINDLLIDLTIQILHRSSPYRSSRHYVFPTFTNQLSHQDRDSTTHTRQFELPLGPDKSDHGYTYILIPDNISDTRWIMLIRHRKKHVTQLLSHDPYSTLFDITAIDTRLTLFDRNNQLASPIRPSPIISRQTASYNMTLKTVASQSSSMPSFTSSIPHHIHSHGIP